MKNKRVKIGESTPSVRKGDDLVEQAIDAVLDAGCNCDDQGAGQYHLPGCPLCVKPAATSKTGRTCASCGQDRSSGGPGGKKPCKICHDCGMDGSDGHGWIEDGEWQGEKPGKGGVHYYNGSAECCMCGNIQKISKPYETTGG